MRRRFRGVTLAVFLASFCVIGLVRSLAQESPKEGPRQAATTFVLRVDPAWADRVNAVLRRKAGPPLSPGQRFASWGSSTVNRLLFSLPA